MDHLLQLSTVACQAERLDDPSSPASVISPSSSASSSSREDTNDPIPTLSAPVIGATGSRELKQTIKRLVISVFCKSVHNILLYQIIFSSAETILPNDRKIIREKIKIAYKKKAVTYDALLDLCSSYAEDQVHAQAPTKLDYYKNGISCCKTIFELSNQSNSLIENDKGNCSNGEAPSAEEVPRGLKRAKTQH